MSEKVVITKRKLDDLANAVAAKSAVPVLMDIEDMTQAVLSISESSSHGPSSGGDPGGDSTPAEIRLLRMLGADIVGSDIRCVVNVAPAVERFQLAAVVDYREKMYPVAALAAPCAYYCGAAFFKVFFELCAIVGALE